MEERVKFSFIIHKVALSDLFFFFNIFFHKKINLMIIVINQLKISISSLLSVSTLCMIKEKDKYESICRVE